MNIVDSPHATPTAMCTRGSTIAIIPSAFVCAVLCAGCGNPAPSISSRADAIIGAEPDAQRSGVAHIAHPLGDATCSGALLTPALVLTAKHCVFRRAADGDEPLSVEGFRIGFGPDLDHLQVRSVRESVWIGMPEERSVAAAVEAGEDVALLHLTEPAPESEDLHDVALDFEPLDQEEVQLAGFGISDPELGVHGTLLFGRAHVTGFDPDTGGIQVSGGASACFGDSGGPLLSADLRRVLGVIGEVGGSSSASFCDVGLSFAATAANARVRRLIAKECARVGGCSARAAAADAGSGVSSDAGQAPGLEAGAPGEAMEPEAAPQAGSSESGAPDTAEAPELESDEPSASPGSCNLRAPARASCTQAIPVLALLAFALRRRRSGAA